MVTPNGSSWNIVIWDLESEGSKQRPGEGPGTVKDQPTIQRPPRHLKHDASSASPLLRPTRVDSESQAQVVESLSRSQAGQESVARCAPERPNRKLDLARAVRTVVGNDWRE